MNRSRYMRELRAIRSLNRSDEVELVTRFIQGDRGAGDELVRRSLWHVINVARPYAASGESLEDLIAEGNLALLHALRKYDPSFGTRFGTYARLWIRAYLIRYVRRSRSIVSTPLHEQASLLSRARAERRRLAATMPPESVEAEVAVRVGSTTERIREAEFRFAQRDMSFDGPPSPDRHALHEIVPSTVASPHDVTLVRELAGLLEDAIDQAELPDMEREIITRRMLCPPGDEPSLAQLGRELGVSREWVRRLEKRGRSKLDQVLDRVQKRAEPQPASVPNR